MQGHHDAQHLCFNFSSREVAPQMNISEPVTGSVPEDNSHEDKTDKICNVMKECCSGMSTADRKTMIKDMMPRMMETMGDDSMSGTMGMMMHHCMRAFRWVPLVPLGLGIFLFLLGYFLSADTVRILWLVSAAIPIIIGLLGLLMTSAMSRR
jgi:hypothetical protein